MTNAMRRRQLPVISVLLVVLGLLVSVLAGAGPARSDVAADPSNPACTAGTDRTTESGPVCGAVQNGVIDYLGIPYAAPPVGDLRWAPPQPPAPWTTTLAATAYGSECAQAAGSGIAGSENCLFINVV